MASEWRKSEWGDIATIEYGKSLRGYQNADGRYRVYGTNGPIGWHDEPLCTHPSIIIGRKGAYRGIHYSPEPFFVIDTAFYLEPTEEMDLRWAYYCLLTYDINGMDSGSAIPSTSREAFYHLPVFIPPLEQQRAIAHILGTLDDKIELNRQMNETLEAITRAIFKSWFVDFDPVIAKADGRQPVGIGPETATLFPDLFVDSSLGSVPTGWTVHSVYDIADVIYGAPFKSSLFNENSDGKPLIRIRDLAIHNPRVFTAEQPARGYLVQPGDLVVGMDGEFRAYLWKGPEAWLNQRVCCFKSRPGIPRALVHYSIESTLDFFERSKTGTTVIHLSKSDIDTFKILVPPESLLHRFARIVDPMENRILTCAQESRGLADIRDTLLPKLISGEIRVKDAEKFVEEHAG